MKNNQLLSIYSKYSDNYFYIAHYFKFELSQINYLNPSDLIIQLRYNKYETNSYPFNDKYSSLTDYTKIDDKRIVFFYTSKRVPEEYWKLVIIIIDIPPESDSLIITPYRMVLDNLEPNFQISGFSYNGFIVFASTFILENKNNNDFDDSNYYFSLFMIFGYPNGTDSIVDISYFLSDNDNYRSDFNFFNFLFENFTIENNFFGYIPVNNIKLVSIPKEILILQSEQQNENDYENGNENEEESIQYTQLGNNSFLKESYYHVLKQNKILIKSAQYYFIDYQYIVTEKEEKEEEEIIRKLVGNLEPAPPKVYYGRINRLQFKLCNDFCETCYELGISENNPKCLSCLPKYQYDYWHYFNNTLGNCVSEGYYYDIENNSLVLCNSVE